MDYDADHARRLAMMTLRQSEFARQHHIDPDREIQSPLLREQVRMATILAEQLLAACRELDGRTHGALLSRFRRGGRSWA